MRNIYIAACVQDGGIYRYSMDEYGKTVFLDKTDIDKPMYMFLDEGKMYVILKEVFPDKTSGIMTYDVDCDGKLSNPSEIVSTKGEVACHLWVCDGDAYVANYVSGSVIKMPDTLRVHEGSGPDKPRQAGPHTHFVTETPDGYMAVCDLGLDTIFFYDKDMNLKFSLKVPEGHGARHLAFSPEGRLMYCVNEVQSTVSVFRYCGEKSELLKTYKTLPDDFKDKNLAAAIRISDGFLYVSNRGYDGVTSFKINGEELELCDYFKVGSHPRDINIFGDILVCTNMLDNNVTFYKLSEGRLSGVLNTISDIGEPLCVI